MPHVDSQRLNQGSSEASSKNSAPQLSSHVSPLPPTQAKVKSQRHQETKEVAATGAWQRKPVTWIAGVRVRWPSKHNLYLHLDPSELKSLSPFGVSVWGPTSRQGLHKQAE